MKVTLKVDRDMGFDFDEIERNIESYDELIRAYFFDKSYGDAIEQVWFTFMMYGYFKKEEVEEFAKVSRKDKTLWIRSWVDNVKEIDTLSEKEKNSMIKAKIKDFQSRVLSLKRLPKSFDREAFCLDLEYFIGSLE